MHKILLFCLAIIKTCLVFAQPAAPGTDKIIVAVVNDNKEAVHLATVGLLRSKDSGLVKACITNPAMEGLTYFKQADEYSKLTRISRIGTIGFTYLFGKS